MKYRQESRQIGAMRRTLENIKEYEKILKDSSITEIPEKMISDRGGVEKFCRDKLSKALECVQNLEAKTVKASVLKL